MITVHATKIHAHVFKLDKIKIRQECIEIMQDIGTHTCQVERSFNNPNPEEPFDGPICRVVMTSGRVLFINATSEELEGRSA